MFIFLILILILIFFYFKFFKNITLSSVNLITGAVKTGKSTLAVHLALKTYRSRYIKWCIQSFFCKIFRKSLPERPLLYSNIPVRSRYGYVPLTRDMLRRRVRIAENSVIYIGEFSLVADSMNFKDMLLNEETQLFFKLIGHESNAIIICDTQSVKDCHYNLKRVLNSFIFIHHIIRLPFFIVAYVREMAYLDIDNNSIVNTIQGDLENELKRILIPKSVWKKFNYRCYRSFTDNLSASADVLYPDKSDKLLATDIVTFRDFKTLTKEVPVDANSKNRKIN